MGDALITWNQRREVIPEVRISSPACPVVPNRVASSRVVPTKLGCDSCRSNEVRGGFVVSSARARQYVKRLRKG